MTANPEAPATAPEIEHSVPMFWPFAAIWRGWERNLDFLEKAEEIDHPPEPTWATPNTVRLDMSTMRLRDFGAQESDGTPVLIDAPYAGHSATIADYAPGQSLVETLMKNGLKRVAVTDWKSATPAMRDFSIDTYLAELNAAVDDLGGQAHLIGLCQGGWLSAMLAARFPHKIKSLVLAGSPIDTDAGDGPIKRMAHSLPMKTYEDMVAMGGGLMPGKFMLAGWKNMHPEEQYADKYFRLYQNLTDLNYISRTEKFESWYENPLDLPGRYYLQAIGELFKENRFARGEFVGLGRKLFLKDIVAPTFLLAGESDDITTKEQVFAAQRLIGAPENKVEAALVPGGHIGLFMGRKTLAETWPKIAAWIIANDKGNG